MEEELKICTELQLPEKLLSKALEFSMAENPSIKTLRAANLSLSEKAFIALPKTRMWKNGRTLSIYLIEGSDFVKQKIRQFAVTWMDHVNIKVAFRSDTAADIRVSCQSGGGSWSYVGMDNLSIPKDQPTMNFGWFDDETPDEEFSRTVLHEFGHALGCIHEHQSPGAGIIPWNKDAVYAYYGKPPNNWSRDVVDHNIFERYNASSTNFSRFDKKSIMLYAIPAELTDGTWHTDWNTILSPTDKKFMKKMYPLKNCH